MPRRDSRVNNFLPSCGRPATRAPYYATPAQRDSAHLRAAPDLHPSGHMTTDRLLTVSATLAMYILKGLDPVDCIAHVRQFGYSYEEIGAAADLLRRCPSIFEVFKRPSNVAN